MNVAKQLYALHEIDQKIEASQKVIALLTAELGVSEAVRRAQEALTGAQAKLAGLLSEQKSLEWDIDDLSVKLQGIEKDLYSGRIRIPKELSSLQQEIASIKARRSQLEDRVLAIMEQIEAGRSSVTRLSGEFQQVETAWKTRQDELNRKIHDEKQLLDQAEQKKGALLPVIAADSLQIYQSVKQRKGYAVASVEQGVCRGCRISLPASELQAARGGKLVQCGSCGRILYLP